MWSTYKHVSKKAVCYLFKIICPLNLIITQINTETSILGTPDGNNPWIVFEYEWVIFITFLILHAPAHDGKTWS